MQDIGKFFSEYRLELTAGIGLFFCLVLFIVTRIIFPSTAKAKAVGKKGGKQAGKSGSSDGSPLDDDDDSEYKDSNLFGKDSGKGGPEVFKDWD